MGKKKECPIVYTTFVQATCTMFAQEFRIRLTGDRTFQPSGTFGGGPMAGQRLRKSCRVSMSSSLILREPPRRTRDQQTLSLITNSSSFDLLARLRRTLANAEGACLN